MHKQRLNITEENQVTIYVWEPAYLPNVSFGHAALGINTYENEKFYSFAPANPFNRTSWTSFFYPTEGRLESYLDSKRLFIAPDLPIEDQLQSHHHQISLFSLNTSAIRQVNERFNQSQTYWHLFNKNEQTQSCCGLVMHSLIEGGIEKLLPSPNTEIPWYNIMSRIEANFNLGWNYASINADTLSTSANNWWLPNFLIYGSIPFAASLHVLAGIFNYQNLLRYHLCTPALVGNITLQAKAAELDKYKLLCYGIDIDSNSEECPYWYDDKKYSLEETLSIYPDVKTQINKFFGSNYTAYINASTHTFRPSHIRHYFQPTPLCTLTYSVLSRTALTLIPETLADSLYLFDFITKHNADKLKYIFGLSLLLLSGSSIETGIYCLSNFALTKAEFSSTAINITSNGLVLLFNAILSAGKFAIVPTFTFFTFNFAAVCAAQQISRYLGLSSENEQNIVEGNVTTATAMTSQVIRNNSVLEILAFPITRCLVRIGMFAEKKIAKVVQDCIAAEREVYEHHPEMYWGR